MNSVAHSWSHDIAALYWQEYQDVAHRSGDNLVGAMNLSDLVRRPQPPAAWVEGDNIPWDDPGFSCRMLAEHLSHGHDAASRRPEKIDRHVAWIHGQVLDRTPTRILDLGCGPGLYTERLAALGHTCYGVDYSPASIAYARERAYHKGLRCAYTEADLRKAEFVGDIGLTSMIFGEFNTLSPETAFTVLQRVCAALRPGGKLLLEPHTYEGIRAIGENATSWQASMRGLFSDSAHILLEENHWDGWRGQVTTRYYVIDAQTAHVARYARTMQAYTIEQYQEMISEAGFIDVSFRASLSGDDAEVEQGLQVIVARKP